MVDHVKVVGLKLTYLKAIATIVTVLFFFWFIPVEGFDVIRTIPFENLFGGTWFVIVGFAFVLEGLAGFPETKKFGSKFGAYILIGLGLIIFILGSTVFIYGTRIIDGSAELTMATTIILGIASLMFFAMIYSEVVHRKSFIALLRSTVG